MNISALKIPLSAFAFGLVFISHLEPDAFGFGYDTAADGKKYEPERQVIERLGTHDSKLLEELAQLEQQVVSKGSLTLDEYQEIQGQLDELLQRVSEEAKTSGEADQELFGEILELQEVVVGIDVR